MSVTCPHCAHLDNVVEAANNLVYQFREMQAEQDDKLIRHQTLASASENWGSLTKTLDFQPLIDALARLEGYE